MHKFLEIYNLPRLIMGLENLNRLISSEEIGATIQNFPQNKSPGPDGFTNEFCQIFKEDLIPTLLKLYPKIEEEAILLKILYKANIALTPKAGKDNTQKRELQTNIFDEYRCKNPKQNATK